MATADARPNAPDDRYVVVARRYRPQTFGELIGQEHVARALTNAITLNRVGHAYLFTGARGVGKTSAARIFAKALNCVHGPTLTPCNECDICQSVSSGEDVDVLEIDGASNRGIDEIRQLRQNAGVRPSRARFKIYIIDEVHMLTREAFNALLKTLEEPPEHVKFIFCTTEADKIPITILSRCQRFDFAGIQTTSIVERLAQIAESEGVSAEREALELLARRAGGSMRDSQSLLEQLLSFGGQAVTANAVHEMLGTASSARLGRMLAHLAERNAAQALAELDEAIAEGVDVGQLLDQLLGYLRDCMAASVGCPPQSYLNTSSPDWEDVARASERLGLETILAMCGILDQALARMRYSTHGRTLAEMALVRMCRLEDLQNLPELIAQLRGGVGPAPTNSSGSAANDPKKKALGPADSNGSPAAQPSASPEPSLSATAPPPVPPSAPPTPSAPLVPPAVPEPPAPVSTLPPEAPPAPRETTSLTPETLPAIWAEALANLGDMLGDAAGHATSQAISGPNRVALAFPRTYNFSKTYCELPEHQARLEQELAAIIGAPVRLEFRLVDDARPVAAAPAPAERAAMKQRRMQQKSQEPIVRRALELFGGQVTGMEDAPE